jgi:hypothetical protein
VAISQDDVDRFLVTPKASSAGARMRWVTRNVHTRRCHVPIEADAIRVGELILIVNVALARQWIFKLLRRQAEILRWDLVTGPARHRNPKACGPHFPRTVRDLEHEHVWRERTGLLCAAPLEGFATATHRQALDAFSDRANITLLTPYEPPPPLGEQMTL